MRFGFIVLVSLLSACSPRALVTPYKMDVQQGNVVTDEMLSKVKPGMTKAQVSFALGTPLIADPFHADRWDYVYRMTKDGELVEQSRLTVVFDDDKLKKLEGTVLPPSDTVAGTKFPSPLAVPALALAPEQPQPAKPPLLDLKQVESDLGAAPQTPPPAADGAKPAPGQNEAEQTNQAQAEQPKRSVGERFMRLLGFGKKDEETQQAKVEEKPEAQPKPLPDSQLEAESRSFGERIKRLFGFGKKDETQQAKAEEKPEAQPETQPEVEPPTNTVVTADREPPPKRSVGERFMRLIGFRSTEKSDDPAPPVHTEVNNSIPSVSSLSFRQVWKQILGLEDDKDRERSAAAADIEPGEKVNTAPQGTTWQRFKRLIGIDSDEAELDYTPVDQQHQTTQVDKDAKSSAPKSDTTKP